MAEDHIRYDLLTQQALRAMVRDLLADIARKGLPGEHQFFISFDTNAEGVKLSQRMHAQYPDEMTIVLQHQFWDLTVSDDRFEVGLSFNGIPERLTIPLTAIKGFFDPSVQFGLQFEVVGEDSANGDAAPAAASADTVSDAAHQQPSAAVSPLKPVAGRNAGEKTAAAASDDQPEPDPDKPSGGGEVVRLDRFRKK
jgi:hypothetical protein